MMEKEIKNFQSGTETIFVESNWHSSLNEAENECVNEMDDKISSTINELISERKKVVGSVVYSIETEERNKEVDIEYKCKAKTDIEWVFELESSFLEGNNKSFKKEVNTFILEEELLNRFKNKYKDTSRSLTLKSITVLSSNVSVISKISSLPSNIGEETYISENCTSEVQIKNSKLSLTTVEGEKISLDKTITTKNEEAFGFNFKIKSNFFDFGGEVNNTQTWEMKIGSYSEKTITRTRNYSEDFTQKVNPSKGLLIKIKREITNDIYNIGGTIIFDGIIEMVWEDCQWHRGHRNCGPMYDKISLSTLLSEEERTLNVEGKILISSSNNTKTTTFYKEFDANCSLEVKQNFIDNEGFRVIGPLFPSKEIFELSKEL